MPNVNSGDTNVGNIPRQPPERTNEQLLDDQIHDPVAPGLANQSTEDMPADEHQAARRKVMRSYESVLGALSSLISKRGGDDLDIELASAIAKMKRVIGDVQTGKLLGDNERKRAFLYEKQQKIQEAENNLTQVAEKSEKKSLWAKITSIFSVVVSAVEIVIGAITCVANPVAGAAMIAAGAIGLVLAADSVQEGFNGEGFLSDKAKNALMGCMLALTVVSIASCLGPMLLKAVSKTAVGRSALKAAKSLTAKVSGQTAQNTAKAGQSAAKASEGAVEASMKSKRWVTAAETGGNVMSTGAQAGELASTIKASTYDLEIADIRSDAGRSRAEAKAIEAITLVLDEFIDVILDQISREDSRWAAMLEGVMASMEDRGKSIARIQFSG